MTHRTARAIVHRLLARTRGGLLEVREPGGSLVHYSCNEP